MLKLLKKEFVLSMHPIVPAMILLSAMVLIPNYPYTVMFFYVTMGIFFTCLLGRENNDVVYTLSLPVSKRDVVKARILFAVIFELLQLVLTLPLIFLSAKINPTGNAAGLDANVALLGQGLAVYGVFNLVFFSSYYKNVTKVGISFVKSCIVLFIAASADVVCTYTVPYVKDVLDTVGNENFKEKLLFLAVGAVLFAALTMLAYSISANRFEKQDI